MSVNQYIHYYHSREGPKVRLGWEDGQWYREEGEQWTEIDEPEEVEKHYTCVCTMSKEYLDPEEPSNFKRVEEPLPKLIQEIEEEKDEIPDNEQIESEEVMKPQEAHEKARAIDKDCTAYDFQWARMVEVQHQDGTHMCFRWAFVREIGRKWIAVFTEHNGYHVYHTEDLQLWQVWELKEVNGEKVFNDPPQEEGQ